MLVGETGVATGSMSFAGTEGRRAMAVRALCHWNLRCEYHLEVFEARSNPDESGGDSSHVH